MSEMTTFTPSLRNRSAQALPMPRAAPVITATLPDNFMSLAPASRIFLPAFGRHSVPAGRRLSYCGGKEPTFKEW
jgi:hypothetical protein